MSEDINKVLQEVMQDYLGTMVLDSVTPILTGFSFAKNYKVVVQGKAYFVRLLSMQQKSSSRDKEALMTDLASQHHLGPQLNYRNDDNTIFIIDFLEGASLSINDFYQPDCFNEVVDLIKLLHKIKNNEVPPCMDVLGRIQHYCSHADPDNVDTFIELDAIQIPLKKINKALEPHRIPSVVHNDLNIENFFRAEKGALLLLDWADGGLGEPFLDLSMLAMLLNEQQRNNLLARYYSKPTPLQVAQLHLTCALYLVAFAAWGLQQIKKNNYTVEHASGLEALLAKEHPRFIELINHIRQNTFSFKSGAAFQVFYEVCLQEFAHFVSTKEYADYLKVCND